MTTKTIKIWSDAATPDDIVMEQFGKVHVVKPLWLEGIKTDKPYTIVITEGHDTIQTEKKLEQEIQ